MAKQKIAERQVPTDPTARRAWIRLELARRGYTLKSLSRRKGCSYSMLRQAIGLKKPKAERIIATAIGVDVQTIWPERYGKEAA